MEEETIKEKLNFYKGKPIELHIVKKKKVEYKDAEWLNCFILSEEDGAYKVKERKFGEVYLFASEIFSVEEVREKGEKEDYGQMEVQSRSFYQP